MADSATIEKKKAKIPKGSIKLLMAGDLILARCQDQELAQLFHRYESLLEAFANMDRDERLINYRFLTALILTSFAKKTKVIKERKDIFDLKNALIFALSNDEKIRHKLAFRYLVSKNFRVTEFCPLCSQKNESENLPKHRWKFCRNCVIDRKFYNVLSIHHRFSNGAATIFLSNDLIGNIKNNTKPIAKGKIDDFKEEARFENFHYNVKNLDIFDFESVKAVQSRLTDS